jgi:hypothetical protein
MGILDFAYLSVIIVFVALGFLNIWNFANKRRNDSIRDYLHEREQRKQEFLNN